VKLVIAKNKQKPGENVVEVDDKFPYIRSIDYRLGFEETNDGSLIVDSLFTHHKEHFNHSLVQMGYTLCNPVLDPGMIRDRQAVIEAFRQDMLSGCKLLPMLDTMQLINKFHIPENGPLQDYKKILERYKLEADRFVETCRKTGGTLDELADHCQKRIPHKNISSAIAACKKGRFDHIAIQIMPLESKKGDFAMPMSGAIRAYGIMGNIHLRKKTFVGQTNEDAIGIGSDVMVRVAVRNLERKLNELFAPLSALYCEAGVKKRRMDNGWAVCNPEINQEGFFEVVDAEPIVHTRNPVGCTLSYNAANSRIILNGLHSGGKTHLLANIPLYHLAALSGFCLPARSAKVPVVKRVFHSFDIQQEYCMGKLESELSERAEFAKDLRKGDMLVIDEFLQHAAPDAAADLEPVILEQLAKTGATVIVVTHRGEGIADGEKWNFYSPGYKMQDGRIVPTYKFHRGKPDPEIMLKHASQLLNDIKDPLSGGFFREAEIKPEKDEHHNNAPVEFGGYNAWIHNVQKIVLDKGEYYHG
jgi:hypothetical protein